MLKNHSIKTVNYFELHYWWLYATYALDSGRICIANWYQLLNCGNSSPAVIETKLLKEFFKYMGLNNALNP